MDHKLKFRVGAIAIGICAVVVSVVLLTSSTRAAVNPTFTVDSQTASVGNNIYVHVVGTNFTVSSDVAALNFDLRYNSSTITYTGYTANVAGGGYTVNNVGNYVSVVWDPGTSALLLDGSNFITFNFTVSTSTSVTTSVSIDPGTIALSDSLGDGKAVNLVDGILTLNPPTIPTATSTITFSSITSTTLVTSWTDVVGATSYKLYSNESGSYTLATSTAATTSPRTGLTSNQAYSYYVIASNVAGDGPTSSVFTTTTSLIDPPTAPSSATSTSPGTTNMVFSWTDNSSDETSFVVEASANGGSYAVVSTTAANATSTNVTSLTPNTAYTFRVKAVNAGGSSSYATTPSANYTNAADVAGQVATATTSATISLQWNANSNPAGTVYQVYGVNITTTTVTSTGSTVTTIVSVPTPNTQYTISVRSQNYDGSYTTAQTVTEYAKAAVPTTPTVSAVSTSSLVLTWTSSSNPGTTVYQIYNYTTSAVVATTTAVTTSVSGLSPNTSYQFQVQAENLGLVGTYSSLSSNSTATDTLPVAPGTPTGVAVGDGQINLSWAANSNGAGTVYQIYNYTSSTAVATTANTSYSVTGLSPDTLYQFNVRTRYLNNSSLYSEYSASSTAVRTLANVASTPTVGATVKSLTSLSVALTADTNPSSVTYAIYNATAGNYLDATGNATTTPVYQSAATWDAGVTVTGLSVNTGYNFKAIARNSDSVDSATSSADTVYTLSNVPSSLSATALNGSQIQISWSGDSTQYGVSHSGGAYSWTSGNSYTVTGLTCRTSYTFTVKGRNGNDVDTATTTIVQSTGNCASGGGGTGSTPPVVSSVPSLSGVVVGSEAKLSFSVSNVAYMAISEDPNFSDASWEPYFSTKNIKLSSGSGVKTIYVKFRSATAGDSQVYKITVNAGSAGTAVTPVTPGTTPTQTGSLITTVPTVSSFQPGTAVKYSYSFKNTSAKSVKATVLRQILDVKGKSVFKSSAVKTVKAGAKLTGSAKDTLPKTLKPGEYTVKVKITVGKKVTEDTFVVEVEKMKYKYFVLAGEMTPATDISFDSATWSKIKSNAKLPSSFKLKYSYTNNTTKNHTIKMVRELVGPTGKAVETKTGKWSTKAGETDSQTITQTLAAGLAAGDYQVRIRAYDWTTKELLAENSFGFVVELK